MVSDKVVAEARLRDYELVLVTSLEIEEYKIQAKIDTISQIVTGKGGTITDIKRWGKRKLAYPINHLVEGNYVLATFKMEAAHGRELESHIMITEEVLRHLLGRVEE